MPSQSMSVSTLSDVIRLVQHVFSILGDGTPILVGGEYGRNRDVNREDLLALSEALRPMEPAPFAKLALRQVMRNKAIIVVPRRWKALWYLERISPALSMRLAGESLRRTRQVQSGVPPR